MWRLETEAARVDVRRFMTRLQRFAFRPASIIDDARKAVLSCVVVHFKRSNATSSKTRARMQTVEDRARADVKNTSQPVAPRLAPRVAVKQGEQPRKQKRFFKVRNRVKSSS